MPRKAARWSSLKLRSFTAMSKSLVVRHSRFVGKSRETFVTIDLITVYPTGTTVSKIQFIWPFIL